MQDSKWLLTVPFYTMHVTKVLKLLRTNLLHSHKHTHEYSLLSLETEESFRLILISDIAYCKVKSNDTHNGTRHIILAKHWLWLPDDGFM
jgi:hypothetical protein